VAFFASVVGSFYYSRFWAHRSDNQTCEDTCHHLEVYTYLYAPGILRHGQQPGNPVYPPSGVRLVLTNNLVGSPSLAAQIPLPGNDDNRGSEGIVGRVMSVVAGRGLYPNGRAPENPGNIQVPPQQRTNEAHTHFYTKVWIAV
jgi:hypothetical protein